LTIVPVTNTATPLPPTATPTVTPAPTLTLEEEGAFLSELMATNGGCELPCWWGIVPGETETQEARDIFARQGINEWSSDSENSYHQLFLGYPREGDAHYQADVGIRVFPGYGTIEVINVLTQKYPLLEERFFQEWQLFSLPAILDRYGSPSYIQFEEIQRAEPGPLRYYVAISYPELGIEVQYKVFAERLNETTDRVCMNMENVYDLELVLFTADRVENVPVPIIPNLDQYISWEDVAGRDSDAFYESFRDPNSSLCVEVARL
jgi:hypothetical protein